jgi:hypothetical protein
LIHGGGEILTFIEGFAPPHNGFRLTEEAVAARGYARAGTDRALVTECHPALARRIGAQLGECGRAFPATQ